MTLVAVATPNGGTGFGSSGTSSVFPVIVTGASPLFVTRQDTVVSPVAGSHSALAAYATDGAAGSAAAIVVVGAAEVVGSAVVGSSAVVGGKVVGGVVVAGAAVVGASVGVGGAGASVGVGASVVGGGAALDDVVAKANPHTDEVTSPDTSNKRRRRSVMLSPCD
jgi:hypothetical protein